VANRQFILPYSVVTRIDVGRLKRELQGLENSLQQLALREPTTQVKLPRTSRLLDELAEANKLNLLQAADRQAVLQFLELLHTKGPRLHMSFGADPTPRFMGRLVAWLRQEIHPLLLLQVGLDPSLGAGCVVRTPNHQFDLSLRRYFADQRGLLTAKLKEGEG
jgi:hypothetical protein